MRTDKGAACALAALVALLTAGRADLAQSTQPADTNPSTAPALPLPPAPPPVPADLAHPPVATEPAVVPATHPAALKTPPAPATAPALPPVVLEAPSTAPTTSPIVSEPTPAEPPTSQPSELSRMQVIANLDRDRELIAPALGAGAYTQGPAQIENIPGGENASFQQVLLRAPGVVEDSFGQVHIRGEHANLTYRINGVLLPQPINVFGQEIDTRIARSVTLIDGALPAQFGLHTAGIVDVTTKSGATLAHNELSLYGGSYDTIQPSFQLGGTVGDLDYFVVGSFNHNSLGIENPTSSRHAIHDHTDQERFFGYFSYRIDDTSRLSLITNNYNGDYQIPNSPGAAPAFTLNGVGGADSTKTNETQNEQEYYDVLAYQKSLDKLSYQVSGFVRYGQITFNPDRVNDLIFQGDAGAIYNNFATYGMQIDGAYILNDLHTIRGGFIGDYSIEKLDTNSLVFPVDTSGAQSSNMPINIAENSGNHAFEGGIYLQDEYKLTHDVTVNYGLRYDRFDANFDDEDQVSPRVNVVWKIDDKTTTHAGYSRYFVPPPDQNIALAQIDRFNGTSNTPSSPNDNAPRVERSNYYDVGISRQISEPFQLTLDGFYKQAKHLLDSGQFGPALIQAPYNYKAGTVYGAEMSAIYHQDGFSGFANFSWVRTMAHDIDTQQFFFSPDQLTYIRDHNIKLDHESQYSVSAGAAYQWKDNRVYVDMLYGSGLRAGFANLQQQPQYYPVNMGFEHTFHLDGPGSNAVKFRFDVVNVFDQRYQFRNGSGLGVNAPQWGQRQSFFAGVTYEF